MSGSGVFVADQVAANIAGQREAQLALGQIQNGVAHPDTLYVKATQAWELHGSAGLLGFLRACQKALERSAR